jgi:hypothetical protein
MMDNKGFAAFSEVAVPVRVCSSSFNIFVSWEGFRSWGLFSFEFRKDLNSLTAQPV